MISIIFKTFVGPKIDFEFSGEKNANPNSSISIYFKQKGKLTRHQILKELKKILPLNEITFIRPLQSLTGEWIIQLNEMRNYFNELKTLNYMKGTISIEPDYWVEEEIPYEWRYYDYEAKQEHKEYKTIIKFHIDREEAVPYLISENDYEIPELANPLKKFRIDYPDPLKVGFIMMKFDGTRLQKEIVNTLKKEGERLGLSFVRADDKQYSDELLTNIRTYMHGSAFGLAVFERLTSEIFNPNVSLEVGYMMAMNKPILFLKDNTLPKLHTDLVSKLYEEFDNQNPHKSIPVVLRKWLKNFEFIE